MDRVYRADEQRHHSRHFVSEVRIQHFRSFGPEAVVRFFRGFNVLVGANGVGKSNVLDATLFALGQDATQMRLRTWTELSNRSRRGPCAVTVTLSNGIEETRLLAIVKDEANRVLRLNGTVSSVQQIRQALQQRGINVESPYLCIRQSAAAALLDSGELGELLEQASGAVLFHAAVTDSQARLQKEQGVLSRVRADIASLEAMVGKDGEAMRALQEIRALRSRARAVRRSAGALHTQLCHAAAAAREKETAGVASRMARCGREAKQLHEQVEAVGARTQAAREAAEACAAVAATARTVEEEARAAAEDAEAALVHACVQAEETREEQRSWDKARAKEGCALEDVREAESERLRGRLLALRQESLHAEEALQQLGGGKARCEGAGGSVRSPARREILAWVDRAENEAKQGHDASVAAEAYAQTLLREAIQQLQQVETRLQAATEEVSRLFARCNEATLAAANAALLAPADKLETFQAEEAAAVESVGQSAMEAESAGFHLRLYEDQRGVETLCTAMRLREAHPQIERCLTALQVIAGRHLGVRIMATSEEAVRAIERARGKGQALRVWPLDRLRRSDHTKEHTKLQHIYGSRVIPPLSLVDPSPQHTIAIQNAFGRYVIVPDDTLGSEVITSHGCPCVTFEGSVHEVGRLQGGYRDERQVAFRQLLIRQRAIEAGSRATARAAEAKERVHAAQRSADLARSAADARSDEQAARQRLASLQQAVTARREESSSARVAVAAAEQKRECLEARLKQLAREHSLLARPNTAAAVEAERNVMQKIVASRSAALHEVRQKVTQIEGLLAQHVSGELAHTPMQQARNEDAQALEELLLDQCEAERAAHQALHVSELRLSAAREDAHAAQRAARAAKDVAIADEEELSAAQAALDTAVSEEKSARAEVQRLHAAQLGEGDGSRLPSWLAAEGSSDEEEDEEDGEGEDKGSGNLARPSVSSEDVAARVQQLREAMSEAELEVQTARRKRAELERTHGTLGCLQEQLHARGAHASRAQALVELQRKEETVTRSIATLTEGIQEMRVRVAAANREAFVAVRAGCIQNFHTLVPAMELDVRGEGNGEPAEGNARFWIRNRAVEACGDGPACGGNAWRGGLAELSGGQRTLLNISLLLAVAKFRPSSLLLLDEVDAALDEHNASRVAALLKGLSIHSQVIAISHRQEFHSVADHLIQLEKIGSFTSVSSSSS